MSHETERLAASYSLTDSERERETSVLRRLEHDLANGASLRATEFAELQARVLQQRLRVAACEQKASERRAQLDAARSEETDREQAEIAARRYAAKQAEFERAEKALNSHRQQLAALSRALPELEQKFNIALRELADARQAATN